MTDEEMTLTRRIQLKELEVIKVFQDICKRHNLRYFAIGGTCLGAVRHKGFIPWDDDVDFVMPYEDYLKFVDIAKIEFPPNYALYGHRYPKHYTGVCSLRIQDKDTAFFHRAFLSVPEYGIGIHIDLLLINGLPPEPERKILLRKAEIYRKLNRLIRFYPLGRTMFKTIIKGIIFFLTLPLRLSLPYDYFLTKTENMINKYRFDCSDKIMFIWRHAKPNRQGWYKKVFFYEDFKSSIEMPFEDTTIAVPVGYDRYLTMDFGDYMTPPPEDKRKIRNYADMIVDFEKSYTYYFDKANAE